MCNCNYQTGSQYPVYPQYNTGGGTYSTGGYPFPTTPSIFPTLQGCRTTPFPPITPYAPQIHPYPTCQAPCSQLQYGLPYQPIYSPNLPVECQIPTIGRCQMYGHKGYHPMYSPNLPVEYQIPTIGRC